MLSSRISRTFGIQDGEAYSAVRDKPCIEKRIGEKRRERWRQAESRIGPTTGHQEQQECMQAGYFQCTHASQQLFTKGQHTVKHCSRSPSIPSHSHILFGIYRPRIGFTGAFLVTSIGSGSHFPHNTVPGPSDHQRRSRPVQEVQAMA